MPPHVDATLLGSEVAVPPVTAEIVKPSTPRPPAQTTPPRRFAIERNGNRIREVDTLTGDVLADFTI